MGGVSVDRSPAAFLFLEEVEYHFLDLFNKLEQVVLGNGRRASIANQIVEEWDNHCNQDENEKALLEALEECLKG